MVQLNQEKLRKDYINWLNDRLSIKDLDGVFEITSPFLDINNDRMQIYVVPEQNRMKLSDDGTIITELKMSGCDVTSTKHREKILTLILNKFGVSRDSDELFVYATSDNYAQRKHFLLQAMLAVNDMFMTSRHHVKNIFLEEVEQFLMQNDIRYNDDISFIGKSGFTHNFDFAIPHYKNIPERIIKVINNPNRNMTESAIFSWNETRDLRKYNSVLYAFLNDREQNVSENITNAFSEYGIKTVKWSKRKEIIKELSA